MRRLALAVLLAELLAVWILASSLRPVLLKPSGAVSSGIPGGLSLPSLPIPIIPSLPEINVTLPNITLPNISLLIPPLALPSIPNFMNLGLGPGLGGLGLGGAGGFGAGAGSSGSGQTGASQPAQGEAHPFSIQIVELNIWPLLLLLAVIAALAAAAARGRLARARSKEPGEAEARPSPPRGEDLLGQPQTEPGEVAEEPQMAVWRPAPLRGWGGSELLSLPIPPDLPLIWEYGAPLPAEPRQGASVSVSPPGSFTAGAIHMPEKGCYTVEATAGMKREAHRIRAVKYDEDVVSLFRLNAGRLAGPTPYTAREIAALLREEGSVKDAESALALVRIFEEVRYGGRRIGRGRYEEYLRALARALKEPKALIC
ncbi:DUF4129 domain-containing protein [Thermoproteus tenax]|uniref:DUF4129 domain-containing protein n=1 Tax=Thermoproteus tenax TaxID=2271 RepID=UPI00069BDEF1|nr:DUF4129 domain-containing protein [Thermoproteus tenax]